MQKTGCATCASILTKRTKYRNRPFKKKLLSKEEVTNKKNVGTPKTKPISKKGIVQLYFSPNQKINHG